jgi:hypothetical protein
MVQFNIIHLEAALNKQIMRVVSVNWLICLPFHLPLSQILQGRTSIFMFPKRCLISSWKELRLIWSFHVLNELFYIDRWEEKMPLSFF